MFPPKPAAARKVVHHSKQARVMSAKAISDILHRKKTTRRLGHSSIRGDPMAVISMSAVGKYIPARRVGLGQAVFARGCCRCANW